MTPLLSLYVTFHVEPNELYLKKDQSDYWTGFKTTFETIQELRAKNDLTSEIKFLWLTCRPAD
ncbi:MAG: hypothetical protein ACJAXX_001188 [Roseivirga sp.]|jgi:hypothetical protein